MTGNLDKNGMTRGEGDCLATGSKRAGKKGTSGSQELGICVYPRFTDTETAWNRSAAGST